MTDGVHIVRNPFIYALIALSIPLGGIACHLWFGIHLECGICQAFESLRGRTHFTLSWTDDGQSIIWGDTLSSRIYIIDSEGTEVTLWIPPDAPILEVIGPADYSPDVKGSKIAFSTLRHISGNNYRAYEIATANLDGSDYKRLTDEEGSDLAPSWSPDGSKIAFVSNRAGYASREDTLSPGWAFNVYIMDADGSNVRIVAPGIFLSYPSGKFKPHRPVWSPDGAWLALRGWRSLYTVHIEPFRTVSLGLTNTDPAWSPDGGWIAFVHLEPDFEQPGTIYIARPNGSKAREVFRFDSQDVIYPDALNLSWSPDGLSLRFSFRRPGDSDRAEIYGLYQVGIDGSDLQKVSDVPLRAKIVWSPDGSKVAISHIGVSQYPKYDYGDVILYTMAADGSDKRILVRQGRNGPEAANGE